MYYSNCLSGLHLALGFVLGLSLVAGSPQPAPAAKPLDNTDIMDQLETLPGWQLVDYSLVCTYEFDNFVESVEFVNQLVTPAESAGHHPDLAIAYNRVTVSLTTHEAGGITDLDVDLAHVIADISGTACVQGH